MTTRTSATITKALGAEGLGEDDFEADLITSSLDLEGDITPAYGAVPSSGRVPLLWQHSPSDVIGVAQYRRVGDTIKIKCTLVPKGTSPSGDLARVVTKSDFGMGVSVGMQPTKTTPIAGTRGVTYDAYRILEASVVAVPADQSARITARNFHAERSGRAARLAEINAATEMQAAQLGPIDGAPEPSAPLTKAARMAMAEAAVRRGQPAAPIGEPSAYGKHLAERGTHAAAVAALQRQAHPPVSDRLVMVERAAARERRNNPKFGE